MCWVGIYFILTHAVYAAPAPFIDADGFVTLPVVQGEDGRLWDARLQCDRYMQQCIVVYAREICQPNVTRFSPSFCWEFGR
jgi:hypothetical protein